MPFVENLTSRAKHTLLNMGHRNPVTQTALRIALRKHRMRMTFGSRAIALTKDRHTILLRPEDLSFVPVMAEIHPTFFRMIEAEDNGTEKTLDFTEPHLYKYRRTGLELMAPTIAEDDSMPEYTRRFSPQAGMTVFDLGAHAGLATIELAQMVGPGGHVYAFEPDPEARRFLFANLERHNAANVTVIEAAIGEFSGEAMFSMDGTQGAGLTASLVYPREDKQQNVPVLTLEDASRRVGSIPHFIKCDIEGGELGMVRGSLDFLKINPIHMAFETHRLPDGSFTHDRLQPLLASAGYSVEHAFLGANPQNFLYATPA